MTNRVQIAGDALWAFVETLFEGQGVALVRNADGQKAFPSAAVVAALADDDEPEVLRVLTGPVYDLKTVSILTLAVKSSEAERRAARWEGVEAVRLGLAVDPTLGGAVEDCRIETVESAEMDRAKWMAGGLDLHIRMLFAAPSPAG